MGRARSDPQKQGPRALCSAAAGHRDGKARGGQAAERRRQAVPGRNPGCPAPSCAVSARHVPLPAPVSSGESGLCLESPREDTITVGTIYKNIRVYQVLTLPRQAPVHTPILQAKVLLASSQYLCERETFGLPCFPNSNKSGLTPCYPSYRALPSATQKRRRIGKVPLAS